jgi:hypothetical protein
MRLTDELHLTFIKELDSVLGLGLEYILRRFVGFRSFCETDLILLPICTVATVVKAICRHRGSFWMRFESAVPIYVNYTRKLKSERHFFFNVLARLAVYVDKKSNDIPFCLNSTVLWNVTPCSQVES